ncbi:MAG: chorismate mutase [Treponema sp.]|jgi:chorismate mutase|nr:chorismate mutase [Treponema sp.]
MKRLYALRGAAQSLNTEDDICRQVSALYDQLLEENQLQEPDIVSLVFSVTPDLDAKNPAAALRKTGRGGGLSLFCVQEANAVGSLERSIRALLHCYLEEGSAPRHVYRNGAEVLRPDWAKKQSL